MDLTTTQFYDLFELNITSLSSFLFSDFSQVDLGMNKKNKNKELSVDDHTLD